MPTEFFDFDPLFDPEYTSEEAIRARIDADANQGVEPGDPDWVDTRQGGMFQSLTQPVVQEVARVWDAGSREIPSAAFPATTFGEYVDYHAESLNLVRKEPTKASGEVLFTGEEGALVASQQRLTVVQTDPDVEPPEYVTTESGVISTEVDLPTNLSANGFTDSGNLPANDYFYQVAAINEYGETLPSTEVTETIGATGRIVLDWDTMPNATGYKIYRGTTTGNVFFLREVVNSAYTDTGADATTSEEPKASNDTGGQFRSRVEAVDEGTEYNVGVNAITRMVTPIEDVATVTNDEPVIGGSYEETDAQLAERILLEFLGGGPGNVGDYERWALAYEGVGRVTVIPISDGPGTVRVVIRDSDGNPVSDAVVDGLQYDLDPLAGQGGGKAPIGHTVFVVTPDVLPQDIVAEIEFEDGYSLDGDGGTTALRSRIEQAVRRYLDALDVGEDVIYDHVKAQFYTVPGIWKVVDLTVEGDTIDIAVSSSPAEVAATGTITLSE